MLMLMLAAAFAVDVDTLWAIWCRAAEKALGMPVGSRGSLLLANRRQAQPAPRLWSLLSSIC
eukprot:3914130-Amphidinium_carterae.1